MLERYFFARFLILSIIDIIQHSLPTIIARKTLNTTGGTLGLSANECINPFSEESSYEPGTMDGELEEINFKNEKMTYKYKTGFIKFTNSINLAFEFAFPLVFSLISTYILYSFLLVLNNAI